MIVPVRPPAGSRAGPAPPRRGFTLLELSVVLGVIALLVALALPAILKSRSAARTLSCQNNVKQLVLATNNYQATHGVYPAHSLTGNPHAALLSFLDQQPAAEVYGSGRFYEMPLVSVFLCPESGRREAPMLHPASFGFNMGNGRGEPGSEGPFTLNQNKHGKTPAFVRDGLGATAAFTEIVGTTPEVISVWRLPISPFDVDPDAVMTACSAVDASVGDDDANRVEGELRGVSWTSGSPIRVGYNHLMPPNSRTCVLTYPAPADEVLTTGGAALSAASAHDGVVNSGFLDGHVRPVSNEIDLAVWRALGTARGSEIVSSSF